MTILRRSVLMGAAVLIVAGLAAPPAQAAKYDGLTVTVD